VETGVLVDVCEELPEVVGPVVDCGMLPAGREVVGNGVGALEDKIVGLKLGFTVGLKVGTPVLVITGTSVGSDVGSAV